MKKIEQQLDLLDEEQIQLRALTKLISEWINESYDISTHDMLTAQLDFLEKERRNFQIRIEALETVITKFSRLESEAGTLLEKAKQISGKLSDN